MALHLPPTESDLPPAVAGPAFLRDGTEVWVRSLQPEDRSLIDEFLAHASEEALTLRGFASLRPAVTGAEAVARSSPQDRLCLLVLGDRSDRITVLGTGEYVRLAPGATVAEVGILVDEPYQGLGIATLLLARLARAALGFGILRFEARVGTENPEMLEVFRGSGQRCSEGSSEGEVDLLIPLSPQAGERGCTTAGPPTTTGPAVGR